MIDETCGMHGEHKNAHTILAMTQTWMGIGKQILISIEWEGVDWINLAQNYEKWRLFQHSNRT
jgi:hypothetical protein